MSGSNDHSLRDPGGNELPVYDVADSLLLLVSVVLRDA